MKIFNLTRKNSSFSLEAVLVLAENEQSAKIVVARNTFSSEDDWEVGSSTDISTSSSPKIIHKYKIR